MSKIRQHSSQSERAYEKPADDAMYRGPSHAEGGIPVAIVDEHIRLIRNVELEGSEYLICTDAYHSPKELYYKQKTNKEVLDDIHNGFACEFNQNIAAPSDFIICKLAVLDDKKYDRYGTVRKILDDIQREKGCRLSNGELGKTGEFKNGGLFEFGDQARFFGTITWDGEEDFNLQFANRKIAITYGAVNPKGNTYLFIPGEGFDLVQIEKGEADLYDLSGINLADTSVERGSQLSEEIIKKALEQPGITAEQVKLIARGMPDLIDFELVEKVPAIRQAAKLLGYDGMLCYSLVGRCLCIWAPYKLQPIIINNFINSKFFANTIYGNTVYGMTWKQDGGELEPVKKRTGYDARVQDNIKAMGTATEDWSAVPITGFTTIEVGNKSKDMPTFSFPEGYTKPHTLYPASDSNPGCELCGKAPISTVYWIQDHKHKFILGVGSECIKHFEEKSGEEMLREEKVSQAKAFDNMLYNVCLWLKGIRYRGKNTNPKKYDQWGNFWDDGIYNKYSQQVNALHIYKEIYPFDYLQVFTDLNGERIYNVTINPVNQKRDVAITLRDEEGAKKEAERKLLSWYSRERGKQIEALQKFYRLLKSQEPLQIKHFGPPSDKTRQEFDKDVASFREIAKPYMKEIAPEEIKADGGGFENNEEIRKFTPEITRDEIWSIIHGKQEKSGRTLIQTAAAYLRANARASSEGGAKNVHDKEQEKKLIAEFVDANHLWFDDDLLTGKYLSKGGEQKVYRLDEEYVVKVNDCGFYNSWLDYFESLLLHNFFFSPSTTYELIGFTWEDGELFSVVKQRFIEETSPTQNSAVQKLLEDIGFENIPAGSYMYYNPILCVGLMDMHEGNVLTKDGVLYFIDTIAYISKEPKKFEGGGPILHKAYLMPLDQYLKEVVPIIKEYRSLIKNNANYLINAGGYNGGDYVSYPETVAAAKKKERHGQAFDFSKEQSWRTMDERVNDLFDISKRDIPEGVVERKNSLYQYLSDLFGKHFTDYHIFEPDLLKSNRRIIKYAIEYNNPEYYVDLLKKEQVTIEEIEKVAELAGVKIPRRIYEFGKAAGVSRHRLLEELYATLPSVNINVLRGLIDRINTDIEPYCELIRQNEYTRYKKLIDEVLTKPKIEVEHLRDNIAFFTDIFNFKATVYEQRMKFDKKWRQDRMQSIALLTEPALNPNWSESLKKHVADYVEKLKVQLYRSILENFKKISAPIKEITTETIVTGNKGFEGRFKVVFENGGSFDFDTQAVGAGGYNIQQFHFRYLHHFKNVMAPDGTKLPKASMYDMLKTFGTTADKLERGGHARPKTPLPGKITRLTGKRSEGGEIEGYRTLLSLFDYSGDWSRPFLEAGWNVIQWDIKLSEFMDINLIDSAETALEEFDSVDGIIAAPPCTDFTSSGSQWWKFKDESGQTHKSIQLVNQVLKLVDLYAPTDPDYEGGWFWAIENPVGRMGTLMGMPKKPWYFHPYEFAGYLDLSQKDHEKLAELRLKSELNAKKEGPPLTLEDAIFIKDCNAYTKKTGLWGDFAIPKPKKPVEPVYAIVGGQRTSPILAVSGGKGAKTKELRSDTPEGFAIAFFEANKNYRAQDQPGYWEKMGWDEEELKKQKEPELEPEPVYFGKYKWQLSSANGLMFCTNADQLIIYDSDAEAIVFYLAELDSKWHFKTMLLAPERGWDKEYKDESIKAGHLVWADGEGYQTREAALTAALAYSYETIESLEMKFSPEATDALNKFLLKNYQPAKHG